MHLRFRYLSLATALATVLAVGLGAQQPGPLAEPVLDQSQARAEAEAIAAYWSPERMASAEPMPIPTMLVESGSLQERTLLPAGDPGAVNGQRAGGGEYVENKQVFKQSEVRALAQTFGSAPSNPRDGPYGPFQRWTMEGNYLNGARAFHGKLFFSLGGSNFVCSATVIGRSTIATAGHCNYGGGAFATNRSFCPSYYNVTPTTGAPHPSRGCWSIVTSVVSNPWATSSDPDYDYACLVADTTGTVVANKIGNVTGWSGRAWNWVDVPEIIFGYPQAPPFIGNTIQQVATTDWYNWDATSGGQVSKIVGNDLTGGSSGGGWFLGWRAPGAEIPDTDGNLATDPLTAGPFINGVNSHKRCVINCNTPPTTTAGVFWQEMTSPPFRSDANDNNDSEDIFALCLAHVNNNP